MWRQDGCADGLLQWVAQFPDRAAQLRRAILVVAAGIYRRHVARLRSWALFRIADNRCSDACKRSLAQELLTANPCCLEYGLWRPLLRLARQRARARVDATKCSWTSRVPMCRIIGSIVLRRVAMLGDSRATTGFSRFNGKGLAPQAPLPRADSESARKALSNFEAVTGPAQFQVRTLGAISLEADCSTDGPCVDCGLQHIWQ